MISVYIENKKFYKQIQYAFSVIGEVLGIDFHTFNDREYNFNDYELNIAYVEQLNAGLVTDKEHKNIIIQNSRQLFSDKYLTRESEPESVKSFKLSKQIKNKMDLISIYNNPSEELFIRRDSDIISTNIDIISDIFFMLSRYEEVVFCERADSELYNRFPARESVALKNGFLHRPVVNEQIELLYSLIKELCPQIQRIDGWNGKQFAACLTHDVDWIEKHSSLKSLFRTAGRLILKDRRPVLAIKDSISFIKGRINFRKDVFWTFDYITDIENRYGFKSTFYFMSGGETSFDNKYKFNDSRIVDLINLLDDNGFECGYHGSFNTFNNLPLMEKEKENLDSIVNDKTYGIRQHFLRFKMPLTFEIQEKLGFLYDCSLGYADSEGFRSGICHPYKPYDIIEDRVLNLWVLPLVVMETSIMDARYSGYSKEEGFEKVKSIVDDTFQYGGVFTLLWHNSSLDNNNPNLENWDKVYERIMAYLSEKKCFGTSGKDIVNTYMETRRIGRKKDE